jgi:phosphoribosylglycinamide formyltransferase-1
MKTQIKKIILLASGNGSNVENIIKYFDKNSSIRIVLVAGNNKNAFVFERVKPYDIQTLVFDKSSFNKQLIKIIDQNEADLLVLAGFLWKIPESVIDRYPNKIINIHPSLLPKFGGKGMYGNNVHKAVMESKEVKTGISIHIVNKEYDKGSIIFQV